MAKMSDEHLACVCGKTHPLEKETIPDPEGPSKILDTIMGSLKSHLEVTPYDEGGLMYIVDDINTGEAYLIEISRYEGEIGRYEDLGEQPG